jgi:hypothetical protein
LGMVVGQGLHPSPAREDIPDMPKFRNLPDRALLIRPPAIDEVLAGSKTWEIRTRSTNVRGTIGLIRSGSGTVVGTCELVDVIGPLKYGEFRRNARKWGGKPSEVRRADHSESMHGCCGRRSGSARRCAIVIRTGRSSGCG